MAKILIDESDLYSLIYDSILLGHLENMGVDNWHCYSHPEDIEEQTKQQLEEIKHG